MKHDGRLAGTAALVTCGSGGIGGATATALAAEGAAVTVVARRTDCLGAVVGAITAAGGRALAVACDVTDPVQAGHAVARAVGAFGRLDTVVNNAGRTLLAGFMSAPVDAWDRTIDLNLRGLLHTSRAALPHLRVAASSGSRRVADLVNVAPVTTRTAVPGGEVNALTTYGVVGLTEALRHELAGSHVRVCVVEPGAVECDRPAGVAAGAGTSAGDPFPGYAPVRPADVADAIAYVVTRRRDVALGEIVVRPTALVG
ncbi:SDR family NAD(P)-dependent oxidoreductase [Streptomyces sp. NPDC004667]|uniref:SDR family NAD(P)-dependent oxidoreductase n=1 Tax=Streptomyces sp. NPDC004667 TaxID=3154285 RepID=UPI00339E1B32